MNNGIQSNDKLINLSNVGAIIIWRCRGLTLKCAEVTVTLVTTGFDIEDSISLSLSLSFLDKFPLSLNMTTAHFLKA